MIITIVAGILGAIAAAGAANARREPAPAKVPVLSKEGEAAERRARARR